MNVPGPSAQRPGIARWAGLGGVAYVVLFIAGSLVAFNNAPTGDDPPAKYISFYSDSGNRDQINIGWLLVVLGVFFFLWFLTALRQVLRSIDADGFLTTLASVGGAVYAALALAGMSVWAAIATMSDDTFHDQVYPELIHAANDAGYVIHASGGVGIGALMIAASIAAKRAALIPRWLGWVGVVSGVLGVFSIFFFPQFLVALWILVAGVLLFRATPAGGVAPPPPVT
jgi:uncharacterized protein DUF4386